MTTTLKFWLAGTLLASSLALAAPDAGIAAHPDQLTFPPLQYEPPKAEQYRHVLKNGVVVYVVEDRRVPLVSVDFRIKADEREEPLDKAGLHVGAFELMCAGSQAHDASWIEEEVAFLGARLNTSIVPGSGANLNVETLTKDIEHGLDMAFEVLRTPRYQEDRLQQWKDERIASFKTRNDDAEILERAECRRLMYDPKFHHPATQASVEALTPALLKDWHDRWTHPGNIVIAVTGDINAKQILPMLEKRMKGWKKGAQLCDAIEPIYRGTKPGVYVVNKPVNQTRVRCYLPGLKRDDPNWLAAYMMNEILGGGGMSSNLLNRIRTQEGLAYSVGSWIEERPAGRGVYIGVFQTKVESTQYAMSLMVDECRKMAAGEVDEQALENAKNKFIQAFPGTFSSASAIAGILLEEEASGRYASDPRHYAELRDKVAKISKADVQAAAKRMLDMNQAIWVLVGDAAAVQQPDAAHGLKLEDFGPVTRLPLYDPLTQQPLPLD